MSKSTIIFQNVYFSYDTLSSPLIEDLSIQFPVGWTGIVGANGTGKTTLLKLASGLLSPGTGHVKIPGKSVYCQQRTDHPIEIAKAFMQATDRNAYIWKGKLGIKDDWLENWSFLSFGERKRFQIAIALWQEPDVLAIDEPTNHLDNKARATLFSALHSFSGIGLIVSHDRELLDLLCPNNLFVEPPGMTYRPGKISEGLEQMKLEEKSIQMQYSKAKQSLVKLKQNTARKRDLASRANQIRSKRKLNIKDHDGKSKVDAARMSGRDAIAGRQLNQLGGRVNQAGKKLDEIIVKKTYATGIWQNGEKSTKNQLFCIPGSRIDLDSDRVLSFPELSMQPHHRIALTGLNGSGKSTLIKHLLKYISLPAERLIYLPQEIDLVTSKQILSELHKISGDQLGFIMTVINRLGTRPPRLLESVIPSPGEMRKILLAMGALFSPHLIIMDEPTNHLDLISIQCLEEMLQEFPAGLLLISHDQPFLDKLTQIRWHIGPDTEDSKLLQLHIQ